MFSTIREILLVNYSIVVSSSKFNVSTIRSSSLPVFHFRQLTQNYPLCIFTSSSGTGSRLGLGFITFSCVSLASFNQKHFHIPYFFIFATLRLKK